MDNLEKTHKNPQKHVLAHMPFGPTGGFCLESTAWPLGPGANAPQKPHLGPYLSPAAPAFRHLWSFFGEESFWIPSGAGRGHPPPWLAPFGAVAHLRSSKTPKKKKRGVLGLHYRFPSGLPLSSVPWPPATNRAIIRPGSCDVRLNRQEKRTCKS